MTVQLLGQPDGFDQELYRHSHINSWPYKGIDLLNTKLSEDILARVASQLKYPGDLRALSLTSRKLHRIALPLLFAHVDFRPETRRPKHGYIYYTQHAEYVKLKFRLFVVLMLQRPDLAVLVRSFFMTPGFDSYGSGDFLDHVPSEEDWNTSNPVFQKAIDMNAHSEEERASWMKTLRDGGNDDPLLALLLLCFTNLSRLALRLPQCGPFCERMMDRCALREKPFDRDHAAAFSQLESFGGCYFDDYWGMSPYWFARCLRLLNIKRIFMDFVGTGSGSMNLDGADEHLAVVPAQSSSCEYIELQNSKLSNHDIKKTVEACRKLRTFMYQIGRGYLICGSPDIRHLVDALSGHEDSLERLSLEQTGGDEGPDDAILLAPVSFSSFKRLTHIRINPVFLTGRLKSENVAEDTPRRIDLADTLPDLFPPSLERLCISDAQCPFQIVTAGLQRLLQNRKTTHPAFRELILEGSWTDQTDCWPGLSEIQSMSSQVGVTFVVLGGEKPDADEVELRSRWGMDDEYCWEVLGSGSRPFRPSTRLM